MCERPARPYLNFANFWTELTLALQVFIWNTHQRTEFDPLSERKKNNMKNYRCWISLAFLFLTVTLFPLLMIGCASEADKSFEEAQTLYDQENYDGAIAKYTEALETSTKAHVKERALYLIGWTHYRKLENYEQALIAFQKLMAEFPQNRYLEETMFRSAYSLGQLGRDEEALAQYTDLASRFPESQSQYLTLAYFNQGATYYRQRNYESALENYQSALDISPDINRQAEIQYRIGLIHLGQKNFENAIAAFENAIAAFENAIAAFELQSKENLKSEDLTETELNLGRAKKGVADTYFTMEEWDKAITGYNRVIKEHSEAKEITPDCFYRIGKSYYMLSTKSQETDRINPLSGNSDDFDIQEYVAASANPDNFKEGLDWYQETLKNFPDSVASRFQIEWDLVEIWETSYKERNYDNAQLALQKLFDNFQEGSAIVWVEHKLYLMGAENRKQQNYEHALRTFQELVNNFPESSYAARARYYIGEANYHLQNYEDSRKTLNEFLMEPIYFLKGEARRLIAQSYLNQKVKDYNQAYLNFDKLTTEEFRDDNDLRAEAMYKAAYCLKALKVDDDALGRYTEFMTRFPDSEYITDAYFDLGVFYAYDKHDYELARFNYNRALKSEVSSKHSKAKIQSEIGHTYYNQGDLEKANAAYNLLLQKYPESQEASSARIWIAHIYRREKKTDEAIEAYKSIIEDYAEGESVNINFTMDEIDEGLSLSVNLIAASYSEIGEAFFVKENFEKAFESYARIVQEPADGKEDFRKDPYAPFALHKALVVLHKLGRNDQLETFGTTYINALRENEPILSAEAQLKLSDVLREESEQYDRAAAEYAKLENYPPKPYPRLNLIKLRAKYYEGLCYEKGTRPDKSVKAYQEAVRLFEAIFQPLIDIPNINAPNSTKEEFDYCIQTAYYYVGLSYFATDQFEKAIFNFEEFLKAADTESKKTKTARDKIEAAHKKLSRKTNLPKDASDAVENPDSSEQYQSKKLLTSQEIAERASGSIVFLEMEGTWKDENGSVIDAAIGTGSGFFIDSNQIATNYHIVAPKYVQLDENSRILVHPLRGTARIAGTDRKYAILGYTAVHPDLDLAILKVRAFDVKPLPFGNSEKINPGEAVYPIGNPRGLVNVVSDGQISSIQWVESIRALLSNKSELVRDVQREDTLHKLLMMTAPISPGNSGGPVLNREGKVIGVSVGVHNLGQNLNFAVPVNYLKALLKRAGPPKPLSDLEVVYNP